MEGFFEQQPITSREIRSQERKTKKRRHRAGYPTPGFYFFSFMLNLFALLFTAWLLKDNLMNMAMLMFAFLAGVGVGITVFSTMLKPVSGNFVQRKKLVAATVAYGFVLLTVQLGYGLLNPSYLFG